MLELGDKFRNNKFPNNIIEIREWIKIQPRPYLDLPWNHWDNINALLKSKIGHKLYTESCWSDIHGLYEATLYNTSMDVEIGDELKNITISKGRVISIYSWMVRGKIYVDKNNF